MRRRFDRALPRESGSGAFPPNSRAAWRLRSPAARASTTIRAPGGRSSRAAPRPGQGARRDHRVARRRPDPRASDTPLHRRYARGSDFERSRRARRARSPRRETDGSGAPAASVRARPSASHSTHKRRGSARAAASRPHHSTACARGDSDIPRAGNFKASPAKRAAAGSSSEAGGGAGGCAAAAAAEPLTAKMAAATSGKWRMARSIREPARAPQRSLRRTSVPRCRPLPGARRRIGERDPRAPPNASCPDPPNPSPGA